MKKICVFIFTVIALVSCNDKDSKQDWGGMEYYTFEVSGKVTGESGKPVYGITVEALGVVTTTKTDGTYKLRGNGNGKVSTLFVNFSDTDGDDNGGVFMGTSKGVVPDYVTGAHGPFLGLFSKSDVDAVLTLNPIITPPSTDQSVPLP